MICGYYPKKRYFLRNLDLKCFQNRHGRSVKQPNETYAAVQRKRAKTGKMLRVSQNSECASLDASPSLRP